MADPEIFRKAPLASTYTNFLREERAPKKRAFLVKNFQKVPKNAAFFVLSLDEVGKKSYDVGCNSSTNFGDRLKKIRKKFAQSVCVSRKTCLQFCLFNPKLV